MKVVPRAQGRRWPTPGSGRSPRGRRPALTRLSSRSADFVDPSVPGGGRPWAECRIDSPIPTEAARTRRRGPGRPGQSGAWADARRSPAATTGLPRPGSHRHSRRRGGCVCVVLGHAPYVRPGACRRDARGPGGREAGPRTGKCWQQPQPVRGAVLGIASLCTSPRSRWVRRCPPARIGFPPRRSCTGQDSVLVWRSNPPRGW
jgi:hypothetical protein